MQTAVSRRSRGVSVARERGGQQKGAVVQARAGRDARYRASRGGVPQPGCSVGDSVAAVRLGTRRRLGETDLHAELADRAPQRHVRAGEAAVERVGDAVAVAYPDELASEPVPTLRELGSSGRSPSVSMSHCGRESSSSCSAARCASSEACRSAGLSGSARNASNRGVGLTRARARGDPSGVLCGDGGDHHLGEGFAQRRVRSPRIAATAAATLRSGDSRSHAR